MVNEEIVGGIKNALERGNSLRDAMMSFFNAGYDRKEIEDAAATLLNYQPVKTETAVPVPIVKNIETKKEIPVSKASQKVSSYGENTILTPMITSQYNLNSQQQIQQTTSNFIPKELPKAINVIPITNSTKIEMPAQEKVSSSGMTSQGKVIVAILVGLLIFLVGLLVTIFLFRQQLIDFISSLVS
jgi:hypothetical protein